MVYLFLALIFFFAVCFLITFVILKNRKPVSKGGKKKNLIETIKESFSIHKKLLQIDFIGKKVNAMWLNMGKPINPLPEDMVIIKLLAAIGTAGFFFLLNLGIFGLLLGVLAFMLPDFYFQKQVKTRFKDIEKNLPPTIDLLTLCMEAGIDFMSGVAKVVDNSRPSALRDELQEIIREMQLGSDRREALLNFSRRCPIEDILAFVSVVVQSEELGTSLIDVLRDYASEMRLKRFQKAEKLAMEAPTKMLFPMVVFIFPGVFILIFGPVVLQVMNMF